MIFQSDPSLSYLCDTYSELKNQKRVIFPVPAKSLDQVDPLSIVSSLAPPEWTDSPTCQRCRDDFTITNRKHHCRKCGGTFCQLCSSNEMPLLDMGINEPVRICDTCYRDPISEKRKAKVFQKKPNFEEIEDPELKKAIELSLKEQKKNEIILNNPKECAEDEAALKLAIEASLKETSSNHMSLRQQPAAKKPFEQKESNTFNSQLKVFNPVELENIIMFHQLIGRLVRTRPVLSPEDGMDLKKLAMEMKRLQKRPIDSESVKIQLEESLRGYELLFGPLESSSPQTQSSSSSSASALTKPSKNNIFTSPPQSQILSSDNGSKILNQMRTEVFGSNEPAGGEMKLVSSRLGSLSLSLENQLNHTPSYHNHNHNHSNTNTPIPLHAPVSAHCHPSYEPHLTHYTKTTKFQENPLLFPVAAHNTHASPMSIPLHSSPHFSAQPISIAQMCPEMTVHPHPIHPFTHENPYARKAMSLDTEIEKSKKSKSEDNPRTKKKKKKSEESKETKKDKRDSDEESTGKKHKKSKRKTLNSNSGEKRIKRTSKKEENMKGVDEKMKKKNKKKKNRSKSKDIEAEQEAEPESKPKIKIDHKKQKKSKQPSEETEEILLSVPIKIDDGRKSPLNLIDL